MFSPPAPGVASPVLTFLLQPGKRAVYGTVEMISSEGCKLVAGHGKQKERLGTNLSF
jgi:hypothetical protein